MQAKHYERSEREKKKQGEREAQSFRFAGGFGGKEKKVREVRKGKGGVKEEKWNGKELQRKKRKSNARLITSAEKKKRNPPFFSPLTLSRHCQWHRTHYFCFWSSGCKSLCPSV